MKRKREEIPENPPKRFKPDQRFFGHSNNEHEKKLMDLERYYQDLIAKYNLLRTDHNKAQLQNQSLLEEQETLKTAYAQLEQDCIERDQQYMFLSQQYAVLEQQMRQTSGKPFVENNQYTQDWMPNQSVGQFPLDFLQTPDRTFVENNQFSQNQRQPDFIIQVVSGLEENTQGFKLQVCLTNEDLDLEQVNFYIRTHASKP